MVCDMRNSEKPAVRGGGHDAENQQDWAETILPLSLESLPSTDHQQKEEYFARYASSSDPCLRLAPAVPFARDR